MHISIMLVFWSLVRNSVVLAVYFLFSVACFFTVHEYWIMELSEFFCGHPKAALGFSGGVDSAYLLYEGIKSGADIRPYFIRRPFQLAFELADARKLAKELQVELSVIEYDILSCPEVAANPADRCYRCKAALFGILKEKVGEDGYSLLLDGTNASDLNSDRPGMRALKELKVCSPLRDCGLTKQEIRRLSQEAGLFTWNKPAYACLATRVPAGGFLDRELLQKIERAENLLFSMGFSDFRVRIFHEAARVQLPEGQMAWFMERKKEIVMALKADFPAVLLDMEGRKS